MSARPVPLQVAATPPSAVPPAPAGAPLAAAGQKLTLNALLEALLADGIILTEDSEAIIRHARMSGRAQHPLIQVGETKIKTNGGPRKGHALTLDVLAEWLAKRTGMTYRHIDPLKVDFTRIADVISSAYATRYAILPIEVKEGEVIIATCEPFVTDWVAEVSQVTRKQVTRVIANPADIARYIVEFYNLARSVKSASKSGGAANQQKLEQLVQMGAALAGQGKKLDQDNAHIAQIVDWLWQYAFENRASDIHLEPKREFGVVRFRIDGVLHQVY
ncbi:hypothetical protein BH10PSE17_BH10PSE17_38800 [soil metagenome]